MVEILAAGAVLWRPGVSAPVEIAVVHRPRYDDWSLPKGKLQPGETLWAAAAREVAEETGFSATLGRFLGRVSYPIAAATKTVEYVAARALSGRFKPNREVDELRWLPPPDAANLLSYPHDLDIVRAFSALPADLTTMALVRHATAGRRADWSGPDELRPLTDAGWQEVKALRTLLPMLGMDRIHCAPLLRCTQTVQPLAEDLGTPVISEPMLSEDGYTGHEDAAVARLREIAAAGGTPVVCSQGGVIPDALSRLAPDSALDLDNAPHRKGSMWLLSFTQASQPLLVAAHYIRTP